MDKKSNRIAKVAMRRRCDDMVYMVVGKLKRGGYSPIIWRLCFLRMTNSA